MKYAIETFDLTKKYNDFTAVNSINFKIPKSTIFGMLGPNGAGKTTTIKMLTCLAQPTFGTATVEGYDVQKNPNEVREKIGMVPQSVSLYKDLTVQENAEMCSDYYGIPEDEKYDRINELMELVDINYAKDKRVGQLSGGQKQKASLVASLVHRPDILFLDEPTIGLDPTTKRVLWNLIRDLNDSGHTIILCSHDMHEVDMLCDNVGIINTGKLVAYNTPQGLKDDLLTEQRRDFDRQVSNTLSEIHKENMNNLTGVNKVNITQNHFNNNINLKNMSFLLDNSNDEIINSIKSVEHVQNLEISNNGRINLKINSFDDSVVNNVIKTIIAKDGKINSIFTEEPSLEDVFINVTSEVDDDARA